MPKNSSYCERCRLTVTTNVFDSRHERCGRSIARFSYVFCYFKFLSYCHLKHHSYSYICSCPMTTMIMFCTFPNAQTFTCVCASFLLCVLERETERITSVSGSVRRTPLTGSSRPRKPFTNLPLVTSSLQDSSLESKGSLFIIPRDSLEVHMFFTRVCESERKQS